jgi:GntR family transcriptional regulator, carbon starvation induced regulator
MLDASRKETISSRVLAELRSAILTGELAPGAKINLDHLRSRFDSSISPLREALARLTGDGLVLFEDQRGFRVAPVSRAECADLAALHGDLEVSALRAAIKAGGMDWESGIIGAQHRLQRFSPVDTPGDWARAHDAFHLALIVGANRPLLLETCQRLGLLLQRYRNLTAAGEPQQADLEDHERLAQATTRREADSACAVLKAHLQRGAKALEKARF